MNACMKASPHHFSFVSRYAVDKLFKNVKEGLGHGLYDNIDWKTRVPKEYHMFAGDYHRFGGLHRPYQFYFKWCGDWHDWFVKMAPPLGLEEEDADSDGQGDSDNSMAGRTTNTGKTDGTRESASIRKVSLATADWNCNFSMDCLP